MRHRVKTFFMMWLSLILVFTLAACGGSGGGKKDTSEPSPSGSSAQPSQSPSGETVELTFWHFGQTNYEELAREYEAAHPNVKIKLTSTESGAHHDNLFNALSAGAGAPDIAMVDVGHIERYRPAQDRFHNLYDLGAKDVQAEYLDWKWAIAENADGSFLFGLPTDIGPTAMFYRVDLFEQAGLPTDPAEVAAKLNTWDAFVQAAKDFTAKTGKPFVDLPELLFNAIRDQGDKQWFEPSGEFIGGSNEQLKRAFLTAAQGIQEGWVGSVAMWSPEWNAGMENGDFAVVLGPAWMAGYIKSQAPNSAGKWRVTDMPEGAGNWGGSYMMLPKEGKHPEIAFDFIKWLVSPENQLKSFQSHGLFPSAVKVYDMDGFKNFTDSYFGDQNTAEVFMRAAQKVKKVWFGPLWDSANNTAYNNGLRKILAEKNLNPEQVWNDVIKEISDTVERQ